MSGQFRSLVLAVLTLYSLTSSGQNSPAVAITPSSLNFGSQTVGAGIGMATLQLQNTSGAPIDLGISVLPSSCSSGGVPSQPCISAQQEEISSYTVPTTCNHLDPGQTCSLTVTFSPTVARALGAWLFLQSSTSFLGQVQVTGVGQPRQLAPGTVLAVEFYNRQLDHYFVTHIADEIQKLDSGAVVGWQRTGYSFWVWPDAATAPNGTSPTCRFYGRPEAGLDSHFYTASVDECNAVLARFSDAWILESPNFFYVYLPDTLTGECPQGTAPIYRLYDNRADADHRYIPFQNIDWLDNVGHGWVPEGYGPNAVVMCSAPGVFRAAS